jgi:hypothetical protein
MLIKHEKEKSPADQMADELMECMRQWGLSQLEAKEVSAKLHNKVLYAWKGKLL